MIDLETRPGTNYYANLGTREEPRLVHIGKAAYGIRYVIRCNPEQYNNEGKVVAKYDCVDMNSHTDMTAVYLKRTVFDLGTKAQY